MNLYISRNSCYRMNVLVLCLDIDELIPGYYVRELGVCFSTLLDIDELILPSASS